VLGIHLGGIEGDDQALAGGGDFFDFEVHNRF
jgi:hypothetical protein